LTDKGFDQKYGARPLRRALQKYVEDPMAESILNDEIGEGDTIEITHEGDEDELSFEVVHSEPTDDADVEENGEADELPEASEDDDDASEDVEPAAAKGDD